MLLFLFFTNFHIVNGKKKLNFSEFSSYDQKKRIHKIEECIEEIEKDEMPLKSYLYLHKDASLNNEKKEILVKYFKSLLVENIK